MRIVEAVPFVILIGMRGLFKIGFRVSGLGFRVSFVFVFVLVLVLVLMLVIVIVIGLRRA